ncbi:Ldh family oxidoreductase [Klebsiella spallanzanii]
MSTVYVKEENLKSLVYAKLFSAGLDEQTAQQVTDVLVHADLTGVHSHGVMRVEHYCTRLKAGGLNKEARFSIEQISPSVAILDSDDGMGHSALIKAADHAIQLAQNHGLGFVGVKNTSHCGALSYFAERVANRGMIVLVMTQTDTCVAPHGGAERFIGTNPIAFGFPVENSYPMIVDMATSATAFGKILHAKETGKPIGEGLAIDKDGNVTTDPHKIENLLPFGGHKGSGIALAIDALTGILMGASFGNHIVRMYGDYDKMRKLASLIIVIDPKKLGNNEFSTKMAQMVTELRAVKPVPGVEKVLAPNDPQMIYKEKCHKHGIPVASGIYKYLSESPCHD